MVQDLSFCASQLVEEVWKDYVQIQSTQGEKWEALGLFCDSAAGLQWGSLHLGCWQELHHQCSCLAQWSRTELLMCSELPSKQALHGNYMTIAAWRCTISLCCEELEFTYYMWQSRIQLRISSTSLSLMCYRAEFSVKGGASSYMLCKHMNIWYVYKASMSPAPSNSLALQCVKLSDALVICNGIIFEYYPRLPHTPLTK